MKTKLFLTAAAAALSMGVFVQVSSAADESGPPRRPNMEALMKRFDTNGDGKLDATESAAMAAAIEEHGGPRGPGGRNLERFDKDGDGKLNDAERAEADTTLRAEAATRPKAMERIDTDKDGKISDAEWEVARQHMHERRGDGPGPEGKAKKKDKDHRR